MPFFRSIMAAFILLAAGGMASHAQSPDRLTVVSWGGAYEASQRTAYFEPFTAATGIEIEVVQYDGGLDELRAHIRQTNGAPTWDVIDMTLADANSACDTGLIASFDPAILEPAPDGAPAREDFLDDAIGRCWIAQLVYSTVLAYDERAYPGLKPRGVEDFFDIEQFPGKRALQQAPIAVLEWALLSYDVPRAQIYDLLSTERGLDLAFRKLDTLRGHIVWWSDGSTPPKLLREGAAAMASGYNGRFFHAIAEENAPIAMIWDGQLIDYSTWAIVAGADGRKLAERFIRFATRTENLAAQAHLISYGPTRTSARERVGMYAGSNIPMSAHLPTAPRHLERAIRQDHRWHATTETLRRRRWNRWLESLPESDRPPR